jgi:hypothetical protein
VAYVYAPKNPYTYLWGVVLATPGAPVTVTEEADPAQAASEAVEAELQKITLPTIETFEPDKLGAVAAELAEAALRVTAAEQVVAELQVEHWQRILRIEELEALRETVEAPIYAWCCQYLEDIPAQEIVSTAEPPGFYATTAEPRLSELGEYSGTPTRYIQYDERAINILPPGVAGDLGIVHSVQNMTPAQAFHAAAMEPGAVRWKPLWRYAVITSRSGDTCSLELTEQTIRQPRGVAEELTLDAVDQRTLTAVSIVYPPCNGEVFQAGDAVLVFFAGHDRDTPTVIGFRREPVPCPGGRLSWSQLR